MEESIKKAFDFASDSTKQLITLSTAILALTITFNKDVLHSVGPKAPIILTAAWTVYLLSICFGIATLLALTGILDQQTRIGESSTDLGNKPTASTKAIPTHVTCPTVLEHSGTTPTVAVVDTKEPKRAPLTIRARNVRFLSSMQIITFLLATGLVVASGAYGVLAARGPSESLPYRPSRSLDQREAPTTEHYR